MRSALYAEHLLDHHIAVDHGHDTTRAIMRSQTELRSTARWSRWTSSKSATEEHLHTLTSICRRRHDLQAWNAHAGDAAIAIPEHGHDARSLGDRNLLGVLGSCWRPSWIGQAR